MRGGQKRTAAWRPIDSKSPPSRHRFLHTGEEKTERVSERMFSAFPHFAEREEGERGRAGLGERAALGELPGEVAERESS